MNQEDNNLNHDQFDIQSNNELSNSQPINNNNIHQQLMPNVQQSVTVQQQASNFINSNQNEPIYSNRSKSKKRIGLVVGIVAVLVIFIVGAFFINKIFSNNNGNAIYNDMDISTKLLFDYDNKKITADEYVLYSLYAQYDNSLLNKEYSKFKFNDVSIHVEELIDKYFNELSEKTKNYFIDNINLKNVTFELGKENDETKDDKLALSDIFIDTVYAKENKITNLDKAVLSSKGNFIVWYTTTGDNSVTTEQAKKIASGLENTVSAYGNLSSQKYSFSSNVLRKGKTYNNQVSILENEKINPNYLESAMQVYLVEYKGESLAQYVSGYGKAKELIYSAFDGDSKGTIIYPYIVIKPSSLGDYERSNQVFAHELFHHYQYNILCGNNNCKLGNDAYIGEATANWASSLATKKVTNNGFLNEWAGTARKYSSNLLSDEWAREKGLDNVGYALYVYLNNYSNYVSQGNDKIINSIYKDDALRYLQDNATKIELKNIQDNIAKRNLSQDYTNKNLLVDSNFEGGGIQTKEIITSDKNLENIHMSKLGIDYYLLDVDSNSDKYKISLIRDNENVNMLILSEKNGKYSILDQSELNKDDFTIDTNYYSDYDKLYIAVENILPSLNNYYSLKISKTNTLDLDEIKKNVSLNHKLVLNGYAFELGVSLNDFIEGTNAIINEQQFEEAKTKSSGLVAFYYEIESKIIHGGKEIEFEIYIDTSDLDNITVEGISIDSDLGWEETSPGFLGKPNIVSCGFSFLNNYDIDRSTYNDFDNVYKMQAVNKSDEYSIKYELALSDSSGFGIKIHFDSFDKSGKKLYISYVNVTNKTGLVW